MMVKRSWVLVGSSRERVGATDEVRNTSEDRRDKNGQMSKEANKVDRSAKRLQLQTTHTKRGVH